MVYKYDLKVKRVVCFLIALVIFLALLIYFMFFSPDYQREKLLLYSLKYSSKNNIIISEIILMSIFLSTFTIIYMIKSLFYKRKDILILSEDGITYYAPEYGKVYIPKDKIKDAYVTNRNSMKIILNNYTIKKTFRIRFWSFFKDLFQGLPHENIFRINLNFIDCDKKEIQNLLLSLNLDMDGGEAYTVINNICKQYNYNNIDELKNDEKALSDCIIQLYKLENLTQSEIASLTKTNTTKVSKIIRNSLD